MHTIVNKSLKYIEANLKNPLKPQDVADHVGYSAFHFYRLFSETTGLSIGQYITERRLCKILFEASTSSLLNSVFDYQFDTYSGFYKACKRKYGLAPKEILKIGQFKIPPLYLYGKDKYPMITEQKIKNILKNWSLEDRVLTPVLSENGQKRKDMWDIDGEMRVTVTRRINKLNDNIQITKTLIQQGIFTPDFVLNKEGAYFTESGQNYVFVKHLTPFESIKPLTLLSNDHAAFQVGLSAGKLCKVLDQLDNGTGDDTHIFQTCEKWAMPIVQKMATDLDNTINPVFYETFIKTFKAIGNGLPKSVIHRNLHHKNIYFKDQALIGYGDFYLTQRDVRIFDLCYLCTSILAAIEEEHYEDWIHTYKTIVKGYESEVPLSETEKQALPYVMYGIQMIFIAYFQTQDQYQDLAIKNYKIMIWLYEHFDWIK